MEKYKNTGIDISSVSYIKFTIKGTAGAYLTIQDGDALWTVNKMAEFAFEQSHEVTKLRLVNHLYIYI